ncbi:hypothetical protein PPYR_15096, partial [Photinus pyralis]
MKLKCKCKKVEVLADFVITKGNVNPILGLKTCVELNLINRVEMVVLNDKDKFISDNHDLFQGLGKFYEKCSIELRDDVKPVVNPPRRVPLSVKDKLKDKLKELECKGIISKVEKPTGWVSNLIIVEKPDKSIRLCLDPKYLNLAMKRIPNVLIPTVQEIMTNLCNKKVFTVLDLKDGFWQIELTKDSSDLCTFSTPFGSYKFHRIPFGIKIAPEYFQYLNEKNFDDIRGVTVYFDDLLISADTEKEHDEILKKVIERARQMGVKFNKNKLQFKQESVRYLGHIFSSEGVKVDPERVKAIEGLKAPESKKELQSLLGMLNFLRPFISNLSELTSSLRGLLKDNVVFEWLPCHDDALVNIKKVLANSPTLVSFDTNKEITIQADASQHGLGCCLMQEFKP